MNPMQPEQEGDDGLMDHVTTEFMKAIEIGDKEQLINALQVLVHDAMGKMSEPNEQEE